MLIFALQDFFRYILAPYIIVYLYLETLIFKEFFTLNRSCSSVGRAPPRQGGGRWFETSRDHHLHKPVNFDVSMFTGFSFHPFLK